MSYNKKIKKNGDIITKEGMNNIEDGIYNAHEEINTLKNNTSTGGGTGDTNVNCTGISLDRTFLELGVSNEESGGETRIDKYQLVATITPTNCTDEVTWSVSPTGVCTVNNGLVTAVANGQCVVTARCGNYSVDCTVRVTGMNPPSIDESDAYVIDIIKEVSKSLEEKGYDSVNQIVGYLMSDDPGYISNHKDARKKLTKIDRTRILEVIIRKITN